MKRIAAAQSGFTIVASIFLLVVFSMLGTYMLTVSAVSHTATTLSVQGLRAYYAAYSGLEWATRLATTTQAGHDSICGDPASDAFATNSFDLNQIADTGFASGFTVTVVCDDNAQTYSEGGDNFVVDQITVTATTKGAGVGDPDYASRELKATVTTGSALP